MSNILPEGTRLRGGDYIIESVLGTGGFGITYRAHETPLQRYVAIKEFFPGGCQRERLRLVPQGDWTTDLLAEYKLNFIREGRTLARLSHASIVHIYSVFEENDSAYLVMEFIEGQTLKDYLASQGGRLPVDEALRFIRQAGDALSMVHSKGLLHRDLKPANLMLRPDGQMMLIDFGSAREYTPHTQRLTAILTPGYAPYEQYDDYGKYGPYTDVYALSAVLYHLLTGKVPVNAVSRRGGMVLVSPRELMPEIPQIVSDAVMAGLALEGKDRPASAREFLTLLIPSEEISARPLMTAPPVQAPAQSAPASAPAGKMRSPQESDRQTSKAQKIDSTTKGARCIRTLKGHQRAVYSVAWSPDSQRLVSGSRDTTLRIWNATTGETQRVLEGHATVVNSVAWSQDGEQIGSGSWYVGVIVWDAESGAIERTLSGHSKSVASVAWGPNSRLLASGSTDRTTRIWDTDTGDTLAILKGHLDRVTAADWHPDGKTLATASDDKTVLIWNAVRGEQTAMLRGAMNAVASVAWSPDGKRLAASGYSNGTVWLWNMETQQLERTFEVDTNMVILAAYSVAWSPDGRWLAFGCQDSTVQVWDIAAGTQTYILRDHTRAVHSVAWSPDGTRLATASEDHTIRLWEIR